MNPFASRRFRSTAMSICLLPAAALICPRLMAQSSPPSGFGFANPPLLYEGPDPTANHFLPANSLVPDAATITPLPPAEFSTAPQAFPQTAPPQGLTPSAILRRFSTPESTLPDRFNASVQPVQPETVLPPAASSPAFGNPSLGNPLGQGELVFPAEGLDNPPAAFWAGGEPAVDPLELHHGGITEHKDGFFQSLRIVGTWIDRNNKPDDFGLTEVDITATFAVPLPTREWPLLITPAFNTRFLDGPEVVDLPPRLYETYLDFTWVPRFSARWVGILGVAPSVYSDFEHGADGFRVTGKGLIRYDIRPGELQFLLGVLYLGRQDVKILPAGGLIWTPNDRIKYELLFPRPKLAHLIRREARYEDWLYLGAEFGGNSFAIERIPGTTETITLRDYRIYLGLERKLNGGAGFRLEIGYVAGRVIEFSSGLPDIEADETAMIRGGITF